ncbi:MAG: portal protein [Paracoccaceae bacterium]
MLHTDAKSLVQQGEALFSKKMVLDSRNQEIADHFYPERGDFTVTRDLGEDWASHMMTGYPSMVRRDLGNALGSMLRPSNKQWFHVRSKREDREGHAEKKWLEGATKIQTRAMYDRVTQFTRAVKEGDHDFATFGSAVLSVEVNRRDNALLYRCWHLRDVAWQEDQYGMICAVHRRWKPSVRDLAGMFPGDVHQKVTEAIRKDPNKEINCVHIVIRAEHYTGQKKWGTPWVSLYVDCENQHIMEEAGSHTRKYVIPRWMTISGSQYGYSPATLIALPDARLVQAMTLTLLEAGEKSVNPPMVGVAEAIRGDMQVYAGGFTAVDSEYDERLGEVLRPLGVDKSGLPYGMDLSDRQQAMLREAFYLNTLSMPPTGGPDMTAYEVGQRVQEYIRQAMPLFEPMEADYNGELCEMTFDTLMNEGAFGSRDAVPESLQGRDVQFRFESPLADMAEREKGQLFLESKAMLAAAVEADPDTMMMMDFPAALRDVMSGIGAPSEWMLSPQAFDQARQAQQAKQTMAETLGAMGQGAAVAKDLGQAAKGFAPA